jgi:hypothetical protein
LNFTGGKGIFDMEHIFSRSYLRQHLDKYDWIFDYDVERKSYGKIEITVKIKENVYIMKLLAEDFDIERIFKNEFLGIRTPVGASLNIHVILIPEDIEVTYNLLL